MKAQLISQLESFDKLSLSDLDGVKLQNRCDTKFTFHISKLPQFLDLIKSDYGVLSINDQSLMDYHSLYYDTSDFDFYLNHHNKRRNRVKIRYRKYVVSDLTFFEIKYKNNKGRTVKKRVKVDDIEESFSGEAAIHYETERNLSKALSQVDQELKPSIWVNFSRITLADSSFQERATIDLNLHYKKDDKIIHCDNLVIAELKQPMFSRQSKFIRALNQLHINPMRISKYCYGMKQMYPDLKSNNFKSKFNRINKLSA